MDSDYGREKAVRIVIYPMFAADKEQTQALLEAIGDALVASHGVLESDDDSLGSLVVLEETDEDVGSEAWTVALIRREGVRCIMLPGSAAAYEQSTKGLS